MRFQQINKLSFFPSLHELTLWVVECSPQSHKVKNKNEKTTCTELAPQSRCSLFGGVGFVNLGSDVLQSWACEACFTFATVSSVSLLSSGISLLSWPS